jgi:hypothetical protein
MRVYKPLFPYTQCMVHVATCTIQIILARRICEMVRSLPPLYQRGGQEEFVTSHSGPVSVVRGKLRLKSRKDKWLFALVGK